MEKGEFNYLKLITIPRMLKTNQIEYVNGYTFALYQHKVLSKEEFEEIRKTYFLKRTKECMHTPNHRCKNCELMIRIYYE